VSQPAPGLVDRLVNEFGRTGRWAELATALDRLDRQQLPPGEQEAWYHARGIVEYRTGQRRRATEIFEAGVERFPESSWLNFGLGQEYEFLGQIDDMAERFQRVRLEAVGGDAIMAIARYYYLWGRPDLGQQAIQPVFDAYYQLKIVDDTFLYIRRLPVFGVSFGHRATFAQLSGNIEPARSELARSRSELAEYNFEGHQLDLDATASGNWLPVLSHIDGLLQTLDKTFPTGQLRMKRAILLGRAAPSLDAALAEIDGVRLTPNDHAWLEDLRTLARAETLHRFGMIDGEHAALARFLDRQPILFEPNHAFNFGFIEYQEALKPRYQSRRREKAEDG
jgi:tetratricopeptide (TPR) repeat protein